MNKKDWITINDPELGPIYLITEDMTEEEKQEAERLNDKAVKDWEELTQSQSKEN
jgi:hypothetical protein